MALVAREFTKYEICRLVGYSHEDALEILENKPPSAERYESPQAKRMLEMLPKAARRGEP